MNRVDLIIPTFNSPQLLGKCLESLQKSSCSAFNLYVVDDASMKPVHDLAYSFFPNANVIRNTTRLGLVGVFNRGIAAGNAEFVCLLNDDTEVDSDWLRNLLAVAERYPHAGSVASKIRLMSDRRILHSAGDSYSPLALPVNRGVWMPDLGQYDTEGTVFGACAGAALYSRSALEEVALPNGDVFDRRLFMYCEDVDLNWRLQRLGYECVYSPDAIVYHHLSATGGGTLASYYVARNIWLVKSRSIPKDVFSGYRFRMVVTHFIRALHHARKIREPAARAAIRGAVAGLLQAAIERTKVAPLPPEEFNRIVALLDPPTKAIPKYRPGTPQQWK